MQQTNSFSKFKVYKYKTTRRHSPEMLDKITHCHHKRKSWIGD